MGEKVCLQVRNTRTYVKEIELPEGKTVDDIFTLSIGIGFNPQSKESMQMFFKGNNSIEIKQNEMVEWDGGSMVSGIKVFDFITGEGKELWNPPNNPK